MKVITINGINTHGQSSTDLMLGRLNTMGWDTHDFNYKHTNVLTARWNRKKAAKKLLNEMEPGDCAVAHSFGCAVLFEALRMGAEFKTIFLFSPAMSHAVTMPYHSCKDAYVVYHPGDKAIKMGAKLVFHVFGKMGIIGYGGPMDRRVVNVSIPGDESLDPHKHSDYFRGVLLDYWSSWVDGRLAKHNPGDAKAWANRKIPGLPGGSPDHAE